jgi:hypothetical protein
MNRFTSSLMLALLLAPSVAADGLQKNRVPANARWVVHLDVEALRSSKVYDTVRDQSTKDGSEGLDGGLAHIKAFAGLDPTVDLKAATLFSTVKGEKSCVALLSGNANIDAALEKLKTTEQYHTTNVGSYALHTWGSEHDTWYAYVDRKDGSDERVVVASQDTDQLVREIGLLRNGGESMAGSSRTPFQAVPSAGSILFAAAGESLNELGEIEPLSAVAKLARTFVLDVGEDRGALFAHVALDTRKPEDAQRIQQVLQGAIALVSLAGEDDHSEASEARAEARTKLQHILESLHLTVSDTRVIADFRYDVKGLVEDLSSLKALDDKSGKGDKQHEKKRHEKKQDEDE